MIDIEKFSDGVNKEDLREVKRVSRKVALSHFGISEWNLWTVARTLPNRLELAPVRKVLRQPNFHQINYASTPKPSKRPQHQLQPTRNFKPVNSPQPQTSIQTPKPPKRKPQKLNPFIQAQPLPHWHFPPVNLPLTPSRIYHSFWHFYLRIWQPIKLPHLIKYISN